MDSSKQNTNNHIQAIIVLFILFAVAIFLLFTFGRNSDNVINNNVVANSDNINLTAEQMFEQMKSESNSEIYNKYLEKIQEAKKNNTNVQDLTGNISEEFKNELQNQVLLPEQVVSIKGKMVDNSFSQRAKYLNEFEDLFVKYSSKKVFEENKILQAQIGENNSILELSDYDRETLLRIATEYELWAQEILNLDTPSNYERKSLEAAKNALNISYVLRKIVVEKDVKVYPLWIAKYIEVIFDILANRHAK